jgi:hypothetical protein
LTGIRGRRRGPARWGAKVGGEPYQRAFHIVKETRPGPRDKATAGDEHIVEAGRAIWGKRPHRLAQPALGPVADDRAADPARGGETDANEALSIAAVTRLDQNRPPDADGAARGRQEVGALLQAFNDRAGFGQAEPFPGGGALEHDGVGRNRLTAESCSRSRSVEPDSGFRSDRPEPISL